MRPTALHPERHRLRRRALCALGGLVVLSACGTTVDQAGTAIGGDGLSPSLGAPDPRAATPGAPTGTPDPGRARPDDTSVERPGGGRRPVGPTVPIGGPGGTKPAQGPPVKIGYSTVRDAGEATSSLGFAGFSTGDMDAQMAALAAYVNARGGLLGRRIVLVNHDTRMADSMNDPAGSTERACATWTQDHRVFAAIDTVGLSYHSNAMAECLAKGKVLLLSDGDSDGSAQSYAQPYGPFSANAISIDRYIPALVDRLVAQRFFRGWDTAKGGPGDQPVKIALMHYDDPGGNRYASALVKALAKHGMALTTKVTYATGVQPAVQGGSSAALKFRSEGVTHVFNANIAFYQAAASQQYYPRLAIDDTINTPAFMASQPGTAKMLHGALGAGIAPAIEVPNPPDTTPAATLCKQIMRAAGQDYSNAYALGVMLSECGSVFLLVAAVTKGGEVSAEGFRRGLVALGESFQPTLTYRSRFSSTQHDGASAIRDFAYVDACTCFRFPDNDLHPV